MNKSDTSPAARKVLIDLWRKMPPEVKFRRVFEAYEFGKMLANRKEFVEFGLQRARPRIYTYDTDVKFERVTAQQGLFTFCEQLFCDQANLIGNTLWGLLKEDGKTLPLCKIVIGPEAKKELRQYLNKLNVTAATLFPGVDGVGRGISEMIVVYREVFHR